MKPQFQFIRIVINIINQGYLAVEQNNGIDLYYKYKTSDSFVARAQLLLF